MANPAIERRENHGPQLDSGAQRLTLRFGDHAQPAWVFAGEDALPESGAVVVPMARVAEAAAKNNLDAIGVRIMPGEDVCLLKDFLPRLALIELAFPAYRDGRNYSSARILRDQFGYTGEIKAIGDVLVDQLHFMRRCGIDTLELHPSVQVETAKRALARFEHVYQAASDGRTAVWQKRG
jgi:uncharacterized protein (DUF934 family)